MADLSRPEAHVMDLNTVNLWLTNAKHQPTQSVEIEGTAATREASITEFVTSVATAAVVQVGAKFAGDVWNFNQSDLLKIQQDFGVDSFAAKAGEAIIDSKSYINSIVDPIKSTISNAGTAFSDKIEAGFSAVKGAFTNPIDPKYTQWISNTATAVTDYATKASSFQYGSPQQVAMAAASTYSSQTQLPVLTSAKDHSNNLVKGSFTVEDAAKRSTTTTIALQEDGQPLTVYVNNNTLRALGFDQSPTFTQMAGIFVKDELHDNLEAALADELIKRNEDLTDLDKFQAWQTSFATLQSCIDAVKTEVNTNQYHITVSIAQENALSALARVQRTRASISDPVALATYEKCLTDQAKLGSTALAFFINQAATEASPLSFDITQSPTGT